VFDQGPFVSKQTALTAGLLMFNINILMLFVVCVQMYNNFESLMDVLSWQQVDVYQQKVFCWGRNKAATHISNQEFVFFRIHASDNFSNFSCQKIRLQLSVWTRRFRLASSQMEFDFCFTMENFPIV